MNWVMTDITIYGDSFVISQEIYLMAGKTVGIQVRDMSDSLVECQKGVGYQPSNDNPAVNDWATEQSNQLQLYYDETGLLNVYIQRAYLNTITL